jgi:hypothetical protein
MIGSVLVFFDKDKPMNPFIGTGAGGQVIDDLNGDHFDHAPLGFIGGGYVGVIQTGGRPIQQMLLPKATPQWGAQWKQAIKDHICTLSTSRPTARSWPTAIIISTSILPIAMYSARCCCA